MSWRLVSGLGPVDYLNSLGDLFTNIFFLLLIILPNFGIGRISKNMINFNERTDANFDLMVAIAIIRLLHVWIKPFKLLVTRELQLKHKV